MTYLDILKSRKTDSFDRFKKSSVFASVESQILQPSLVSMGYEFVDFNILYCSTLDYLQKYMLGKNSMSESALAELLSSISGELYPTARRAFSHYNCLVEHMSTSSENKEACQNLKGVLYNKANYLLVLFENIFQILPDESLGKGMTTLAYDEDVRDSLKELKIIVDNLKIEDDKIFLSDSFKTLNEVLDMNYLLQKHIFNLYDFLMADQGYTSDDLKEDNIEPKIVSNDNEDTSPHVYSLIADDLKNRLSSFDDFFDNYKFVEGEKLPLIELGVYLSIDEELRLNLMYPARV